MNEHSFDTVWVGSAGAVGTTLIAVSSPGRSNTRRAYPSDVSHDEWSLVTLDFALPPESSGPRTQSLRDVFKGLRGIVRSGAGRRMMPNDLPP